MNSFEPKYLKISKNYLSDKLRLLDVKTKLLTLSEADKESTIKKLFTSILK